MVFPVIILDSSFLISFYLTEDENHSKALTLAEKSSSETMLLSDVVLSETLTVLNYKKGLEFSKEAYEELMSNKYIKFFRFTELEHEEILDLFFKQKFKLSFADSSVVYLAKKSNSKVLGFVRNIDKELSSKK